MTQLSLALPGAHDTRTQLAMAQADANANSSWKRITDAAILFAAMRLEEFTVDDVLDQLADIPGAPGTHNLSAMGPRMKEVSRTLGYMEATDRVKRSRRPEKQGNLHRIWRSLVFKGPAWPAITGRTN